jgi:GntR family transcriptional regulator/MocR family aminotransferase
VLNLTITLREDIKIPLYEQLYRAIVEQIQNGLLTANEKLPSKRFLCQQLEVSHSTVETAYGLLCAEGYIEAIPRVGYRVLPILPLKRLGALQMESIKNERFPAGPELLTFSTGAVDTEIFPYASWAKIYKEVIYQSPELLEKGEAQGDLVFRETLQHFLQEYRGVKCTPDQIVVGAGMEYLLDLVLKLFSDESRVAIEDPGYRTFYRLARDQGKRAVPIVLDEQGMQMEPLYASGARLAYVTPSHQFPMGIMMPARRRSELLEWANRCDGYIIEDDYDSEFRYRSRPIPAMQGMDPNGRVIYIGTFSRSIAPSIRAAYLVLPKPLLKVFRDRFGSQASTISRFEQHALERFIRQGMYGRHLRRSTNLYKKRLQDLKEALKKIPNGYVSGEEAGLHFLFHLPGVAEQALIERAKRNGLLLHGLSEYCYQAAYEETVLVMGFAGLSEEKTEQAIAMLQKALKEL